MGPPAEALHQHDYTGTCWWCGSPANSKEHRHKASDLRREFAKAEYEMGEVIVKREGEALEVPGPKSKKVKFGDVFCARCNNERSQPYDRAYDRFVESFLRHEELVETTGLMRLDEIGDDWREEAEGVLCYFVKHIGCRVADAGFAVPRSFIDYLNGGEFPAGLVCSFELDHVFAAVNKLLQQNPTEHGTSGNLFLGPVTGEVTREGGEAVILRSHWAYHGLEMVWEWRAEGSPTGTNLSAPTVVLPRSRQKEGAALLLRVRRRNLPGLRGILWKAWYRLRTTI
jgi:hypothetical protein